MTSGLNKDLDLTITRIIEAPRRVVWEAWTDPASLEQWWVPAPAKAKVVALDLRAGGAFVTRLSEDNGPFVPHMNACFLAVDPLERIVFTDALLGGWRPAETPFMTAVITLKDHPAGTEYAAHVMHKSGADRRRHEELGFHDGWGAVTEQLAALARSRA
jgi:uncharacterized protein YndB with AHSA1/START domain